MEKYEMFSHKDMVIAVPTGKINSRVYPEMEKIITERFHPPVKSKVIFNMENVGYIDGEGVIFLLRMKSLITLNGGYMGIYNLKTDVQRAIANLLPDQVLKLSRNAEECIADICFINSNEYAEQAATAK
jgi:anti-anti-sigma factor